jgi:membrane protease YdiL (CAAX protease family)
MKRLLEYWKDFHRTDDINFLIFSTLLWLLVLFFFNYTIDFEDSIIDSYRGRPIRILWFFLFNGIGYFITLLIVCGPSKLFRKLPLRAWIMIMLGLLILSNDRSLYKYLLWMREVFPLESYRFYLRIFNNIQSLLTVVLPVIIIWRIDRPKEQFGIYGLRVHGVNMKLYFYLFLFMIPIIFLACLLPDIQEYYPTYKRAAGERWAEYMGVSEWIAVILYEIAYVLDFLSVEVLFRGFFVIGLSRFLGKKAIIAMVAIYAMLHFGKPIGEAISSVFGGYILGILAYYSRNIWGGVVLHAGIAVLMEIFAYLL